MRVILIHNPGAGDGSRPGLRGLLELIHAAGHQVRYWSSKERQLASVLSESADLVVAAGGDGTIAKVARLLRGSDTPIAVLPIGTANNISKALGVADLTLAQHVAGWTGGHPIDFDIGRARGPWGSRRFVESFGLGLMPHIMMVLEREGVGKLENAEANVARAVQATRAALRLLPAFELHAVLDGAELSGRFILLEAMNIAFIGPNLNLASLADPTDGQFDVVAVREEERETLRDCLEAEEHGEPWPHELRVIRSARVRITCGAGAFHIDDETSQRPRRGGREIDISVVDRVRVLLPAGSAAAPSRLSSLAEAVTGATA